MLRVVAGGLDRLPNPSAAQPVARGRLLILLAGILAAGLIYINVGKLEGGDAYGRYAARSLEIQRDNTALRAIVAQRSSAERIKQHAKRLGMVSPAPEQYKYLHSKRGDALKSVRSYTTPTPAAERLTPTASPGTTENATQNTQTSTPLQSGTTPASGTGAPGAVQGGTGATTPQTTTGAGTGAQGAAGTQTGAVTTGGGQ
jgi:hypothetical protein